MIQTTHILRNILTQDIGRYPTKKEILENLIDPTEAEMTAIQYWKKHHYTKLWKNKTPLEKIQSLQELSQLLNKINAGDKVTITTKQEGWYYSPSEKRLNFDPQTPSIISTLHETAHHIFKATELGACIYSTSLFIKTFPKEYAQLDWNGHLLTKKP